MRCDAIVSNWRCNFHRISHNKPSFGRYHRVNWTLSSMSWAAVQWTTSIGIRSNRPPTTPLTLLFLSLSLNYHQAKKFCEQNTQIQRPMCEAKASPHSIDATLDNWTCFFLLLSRYGCFRRCCCCCCCMFIVMWIDDFFCSAQGYAMERTTFTSIINNWLKRLYSLHI